MSGRVRNFKAIGLKCPRRYNECSNMGFYEGSTLFCCGCKGFVADKKQVRKAILRLEEKAKFEAIVKERSQPEPEQPEPEEEPERGVRIESISHDCSLCGEAVSEAIFERGTLLISCGECGNSERL